MTSFLYWININCIIQILYYLPIVRKKSNITYTSYIFVYTNKIYVSWPGQPPSLRMTTFSTNRTQISRLTRPFPEDRRLTRPELNERVASIHRWTAVGSFWIRVLPHLVQAFQSCSFPECSRLVDYSFGTVFFRMWNGGSQ